MKLNVIFFFLVSIVIAQTSVNFNPENYIVGSSYANRSLSDITFDSGPPGLGSWNFTSYTDGRVDTFTIVEYSTSIPHITECFVTPNCIPYTHVVSDTSITDGWIFYRVDAPTITPLGLYGTLDAGTDVALSAIDASHEPVFTFPIDYLDNWVEASVGEGNITYGLFNISYEYVDTTWHRVDAFGPVILPIGTFQALRIKRFHWKHAWSDHIIFGFDKVERNYSYTWITTELGLTATFNGPVDSTGGIPDSLFTIGNLSFQVNNSVLGIEENRALPLEIEIVAYPNPFNSAVNIFVDGSVGEGLAPSRVEIFDLAGRRVAQLPSPSVSLPGGEGGNSFSLWEKVAEGRMRAEFIWQPDAAIGSGIYLVRATIPQQTTSAVCTKRVIYLK